MEASPLAAPPVTEKSIRSALRESWRAHWKAHEETFVATVLQKLETANVPCVRSSLKKPKGKPSTAWIRSKLQNSRMKQQSYYNLNTNRVHGASVPLRKKHPSLKFISFENMHLCATPSTLEGFRGTYTEKTTLKRRAAEPLSGKDKVSELKNTDLQEIPLDGNSPEIVEQASKPKESIKDKSTVELELEESSPRVTEETYKNFCRAPGSRRRSALSQAVVQEISSQLEFYQELYPTIRARKKMKMPRGNVQ